MTCSWRVVCLLANESCETHAIQRVARRSALSDNALRVGRTTPRTVKKCVATSRATLHFTGLRSAPGRRRVERWTTAISGKVRRDLLRTLQGRRMGLAAALVVAAGGLSAGWVSLDTQQRKWIFQAAPVPSASTPASCERADASPAWTSVWIEHASPRTGRPIRLHALWRRATPIRDAPVLLYLHGARRDVDGSVFRIEQMRELGFSVLAIDYRGFGNSTDELPSESRRLRGRARRLALARRAPPGRAALRLRPLARRRDRGPAGRAARRRAGREAGRDRRRHLHLDPRHVRHLQVGLAAVSTADHAALRIARRRSPRVRSPVLVVHGSDDSLVPLALRPRALRARHRGRSGSCWSRAARTHHQLARRRAVPRRAARAVRPRLIRGDAAVTGGAGRSASAGPASSGSSRAAAAPTRAPGASGAITQRVSNMNASVSVMTSRLRQVGAARLLEGLGVRAVAGHAVVQAGAARARSLRPWRRRRRGPGP